MDHTAHNGSSPPNTAGGKHRPWRAALLMVGLIVAFFVLREHWGPCRRLVALLVASGLSVHASVPSGAGVMADTPGAPPILDRSSTHGHAHPLASTPVLKADRCAEAAHRACDGSEPTEGAIKDPVCGMTVTEQSPHHSQHEGRPYYFCSAKCRTKFSAEPASTWQAASPGAPCAGCRRDRGQAPSTPARCTRRSVRTIRATARSAA